MSTAQLVLFVLIGLLLIVLGVLLAFAFQLRRRPNSEQGSARATTVRPADSDVCDVEVQDSVVAASAAADAVSVGVGGAVAPGRSKAGPRGTLACPTCRREFEGQVVFCPHDARRLVSVTEVSGPRRGKGSMCPRCRRAFDPGVRFCPHDAAELVPVSLYEATSGSAAKSPSMPAGVEAKICPQCRRRYDLSATFCAQDGSELRTIN